LNLASRRGPRTGRRWMDNPTNTVAPGRIKEGNQAHSDNAKNPAESKDDNLTASKTAQQQRRQVRTTKAGRTTQEKQSKGRSTRGRRPARIRERRVSRSTRPSRGERGKVESGPRRRLSEDMKNEFINEHYASRPRTVPSATVDPYVRGEFRLARQLIQIRAMQ
jgi:hypothetical protein